VRISSTFATISSPGYSLPSAVHSGKSNSMRRFLPYFQLCRLPAVFSAIADICCGFALTHRQSPILEPYWIFGLLVLASCGLYLAGMVLNDVFDRDIDAQERPTRPIPSGRVPLASAIRLAVALLLIGNVAALCAGITSGFVAILLTGCILGYDGGLKNTLIGPVVMGSCRFLNILLGASAVGGLSEVFAAPQLPVALGMGIYIVGVTIFSRQEAETSIGAGNFNGVYVEFSQRPGAHGDDGSDCSDCHH
jgi:4-hydroxybenzoate polyprenyltransferase